MTEVWRPVPSFPGYSVSDAGRVRSESRWVDAGKGRFWREGKVLSLQTDKDGYLRAGMRRDKKQYCVQVHRLVLEAFVGPAPDGMQCAHNDGKPGNCALSNLRWDTPSGNNQDKRRHGTDQRGERSPVAKLSAEQIPAILLDPRAAWRIAQDYGVSASAILNVKARTVWGWVAPELIPVRNAKGYALNRRSA